MSMHESHQFYFERYLRKKLVENERADFEAKLLEDPDFNQAFQEYKAHRKEHLKEFIAHYDSEFKAKSRSTILIYLLITLIVLAISVILYFDNRKMREELFQLYEKSTKSIYRSIPFINKPTEALNKPRLAESNTYSDSILNQELNEFTEQENLPIEKDRLLSDSTFIVQEIFLADKDSIGNDSLEQAPGNLASIAIEVTLWQSPIGFSGYRFNGSALQLFGINAYDEIKLEIEKEVIWLIFKQQRVPLVADDRYYKFE